MQLIQSINERDFKYLEWQAGALAGLICVPKQVLKRQVATALQKATTHSTPQLRLDAPTTPGLIDYISRYLSDVFEVQPSMVRQRIEADGLLPPSQPATAYS